MKLKTPEADDKSEIAGRMYEACDLRMAIEGGHLKTLDDVLAWAKEAESGLQALMELPVWVITENACVDIKASIAHNQGAAMSVPVQREASSIVIAARVEYVNCPFCNVEQPGFVADPRGGDYECDECKSVYHVPASAAQDDSSSVAAKLNSALAVLRKVEMTPLDSWYRDGLNVEVAQILRDNEPAAS